VAVLAEGRPLSLYNNAAMHTVAIIGAGDIGATAALMLARLECAGAVTLIDASGTVAAGKALDILQSGPIAGIDVGVSGSNDLTAAAGAAVVVLADRAGPEGEWRGDAALDLVRRLEQIAPGAPLVIAGAQQRETLSLAHRELHLSRQRLVGSAPGALVSAARAMVGVAAGCSAADVALAVVGVPGSWILAWNECTVSGAPITGSLPAHVLAQMDRHTQASWPPGPYALGSAAARCIAAVLRNSHRRLTVFAALDGEYDVRRVVAAVPVTLGVSGIRAMHPPALSTRERVTLDTALMRG
jgi:malate dehydrogenase